MKDKVEWKDEWKAREKKGRNGGMRMRIQIVCK
jgi:hypothetical protein